MRLKTLLIFLLMANGVYSQTSLVDSLYNELEVTDQDTSKINLLIDIAYEQEDSVQLQTAVDAYELAKKINNPRFEARSSAVLGYFYSFYDLDSGLSLLNNGVNIYLDNDFTLRAANALWFKGLVFEIENQFDSALYTYEKARLIAEVNDYYDELANAAFSIGNILNIRGENAKALRYSLDAKEAYLKANMVMEAGQVLNQIGVIYDQKGLYSKALENYLQALDIAIETGDIDNEILVSNNLGIIYDNMNNTKKSKEYYSGALEKANIYDMADSEATLMNNLSYIHLEKGDTAKALSLLKKSLRIDLSEIYPCFESYPNEGIGSIYVAKNMLDSADFYLKNSLNIASECEDIVVLATVYKDLGMLESKRNNNQLALTYLTKSLSISKKSNLITEVHEVYKELYQFHKSIGNTKKAIGFLESYQLLSDSIYEAKNVEKATKLAAEYDFRKQVELIENQQKESDLLFEAELQSKQRRNTLYLIIITLFALLAIALGRSYYLIRKNNERLVWLNEEKNTLMGMVAHDLRSPLNMIKGLMELIKATRPDDKNTEDEHYIDLVTQSTDKMRDMIERVLDISAVENMKVNLNLERRNLAFLVFQASENFRQIAMQKQIEIQNEFDLKSDFHSIVDPNYFDQVMDNLLSNAIKFSEMGKKIILKIEQDGDENIISVKDQGPGMSEADKEKLFNRFTKLAAKPTSNESSTGLGLSIVQKFVRAMKGEVVCESEEGIGTVFSLKFKVA
ncbi:MAG: tetratricopeptide repeat protein [Ekhidna sp.]